MKKGFTLIELLCVIIIIGLLLILAIPSIINIINNEEDNISEAMEKVILQAGELFVQDNNGTYTKTDGNVYCIEFNQLIDSGYLSNPLKDPITGEEVETNKFIKVSIANGSYNYTISDTCEVLEK